MRYAVTVFVDADSIAEAKSLALAGKGRLQADPTAKAVNIFGAAMRVMTAVAQNKPVLVSIGEQARRIVICEACEFYSGKTCSKCGCVIKFKAVLQTEHCPVGKW